VGVADLVTIWVAGSAVNFGGDEEPPRVGAFGAGTGDGGNSREAVVCCPAAFGVAGAATPGGAVLGVRAGAALGGGALTGGCAICGRCVTAPGRGALGAGVDARIMNQTMAATVASARIAAVRIELAGRGLSDL
jgi:hypothetical protein